MTETKGELPGEVADALASPPEHDTRLLELVVSDHGFTGPQAWVAERLHVFVTTWDPLEAAGDRPPAVATTNGVPDAEVVVYTPLWRLAEAARTVDASTAAARDALDALVTAVVTAAAEHVEWIRDGSYPARVAAGEALPLLGEDWPTDADIGAPVQLHLAEDGWQPIGLGAIQGLVQEAYGPVGLDRSPVELATLDTPAVDCPACAGERFGFVADLQEARARMCSPHRAEALGVTAQRLPRAERSNPAGWEAITATSVGPQHAHLPGRLIHAVRRAARHPDSNDDDALRADTATAVELLQEAAKLQEPVMDLLDEDWATNDWLGRLPETLFARGLLDEGLEVVDALVASNPEIGVIHEADAVAALVAAGRTDEAQTRAETLSARTAVRSLTRLAAADAWKALGDHPAAERCYRQALTIALTDDAVETTDAFLRLADLLDEDGGPDEAAEVRAQWEAWLGRAAPEQSDQSIPRVVTKVGRNDPCPCGSGRKCKRCCGA